LIAATYINYEQEAFQTLLIKQGSAKETQGAVAISIIYY
jgi:hypothetical protein